MHYFTPLPRSARGLAKKIHKLDKPWPSFGWNRDLGRPISQIIFAKTKFPAPLYQNGPEMVQKSDSEMKFPHLSLQRFQHPSQFGTVG